MATAVATRLEIPAIRVGHATITVRGLSPLIVHRFAEKARKQMADKQQGKATSKKEAKNPEEEFRASLYVTPGMEDAKDTADGKFYVPGLAFKAACVGAARFADAKMTEIRGALFIGERCPLRFDELRMREDVTRLNGSTADLRYRGEFTGWEADLDVTWSRGVLTLEEVVNLINIAGFSQGICEWRPSSRSGGEFGRFEIVSTSTEEA